MKFVLMFFSLAIGLALTLAVSCHCEAQQPAEGPLTDVIAQRIEKRIAESDAKSERLNASLLGLFDRVETGRIKERIEDRRLWVEQHEEATAIQGSIRDRLTELRERIKEIPAFDGEVVEGLIEARTGPIREALAMLTSLVWALVVLVGVVVVGFVASKFLG